MNLGFKNQRLLAGLQMWSIPAFLKADRSHHELINSIHARKDLPAHLHQVRHLATSLSSIGAWILKQFVEGLGGATIMFLLGRICNQ